jgi:hypothetical protein
MSEDTNDFIEPDADEAEAKTVATILKELSISSEKEEWLSNLFPQEAVIEQPDDFKRDFQELIKWIDELDPSAFKPLSLFDRIITKYLYYFDEDRLLNERKKILPELFTEKEGGKPQVFKHCVEYILDHIRYCAKKNTTFSEAYQQKLREIRADSFFEERALYYVQLVFQNLPKRTAANEKPPKPEEIDSFLDFSEVDFFNAATYSVRLVAELEEIPENELYIDYPRGLERRFSIFTFPFIVCGREMYNCINKALRLRFFTLLGYKCSADDIAQLDIPNWNEKNYIHEIFYSLAFTLSHDSQEMSMLILNKIFEGVHAYDIPYIFFECIQSNHSPIYGALLKQNNFYLVKDGHIDLIKPIRSILEYFDWVYVEAPKTIYKTDFDECFFFLDYLKNLSLSAPENKLALFQEMSFLSTRHNGHNLPDRFRSFRDKNIIDVLDSIAWESARNEWSSQEWQKKADPLKKEFIDVIAKGAAAYPVKSFLPFKNGQTTMPVESNEYEIDILRSYCEIVASNNNYEDVLFLAQFWFSNFNFDFPGLPISSGKVYSKFIRSEDFLYEKVFLRFINNEDFVCRYLSIPQEAGEEFSEVGQYWVEYYLACLIGHKNNPKKDIFDAAFQELKHKNFIFSEQMSGFIQSNKTLDTLLKEETYSSSLNVLNKKARLFLGGLCAALDDVRYDSILEKTHDTGDQFSLYLIKHRYTTHKEIVPQNYLEFLFGLKNPSRTTREGEFYPLELIREACRNGVLTKQTVLEKVSEYIDKHRKALIGSNEIEGLISYFGAQKALFMRFNERAVQENDDSYTELSVFLRLRSYFPDEIDTMLEKHTENINTLIIRCSKMLNVLKRYVERNEFPEDEQIFYYDYVRPASDFIWERTDNIWKTLKPLLMAFRAYKGPLLNGSLRGFSPLFEFITFFFRIEDKEKLKELRYDMANDFIEYLKPLNPDKEKRQSENYTPIERDAEGFDTSFTEPSPYWRYAYIRALGDLSVRNDKRGHPFYAILKKISGRDPEKKADGDPSEKVRKAADKVMNELNAIRKGYSGNNHKKSLYEAFWWLRQAHMLSLGEKVDSKEALELRIKEWR